MIQSAPEILSTVGWSITITLVISVLIIVLLMSWKKKYSSIPHTDQNKTQQSPRTKNKLLEKFMFEDEKSEKMWPQLLPVLELRETRDHTNNLDVFYSDASLNNERHISDCAERTSKMLVKTRGSCASSFSDSTGSGSFEEEISVSALRHRDVIHCHRHFSFQDQILQEQDSDDNDCVVVLNPDDYESVCGIVGKCGLLEVAFAYDAPVRKMTVHILQARDVPVKDHGRPSYTQVKATLLPVKKQKQRSRIRSGDNPQYIQTFVFNRIAPEEVNSMGIRFRMYNCEKFKRQRRIGECIVSFSNINLQMHTNMWIPLEPRAKSAIDVHSCEVLSLSLSDSTGSVQSMHRGVPELLIGLSYNGTTGRLYVEVIKGSHFRHVSEKRAPDTYVKLLLISSTRQPLAESKTSVRKNQTNPLFKESFTYQVALFQLCDVSLIVLVYEKKAIKKKERIGWFTLGREYSSDEELAHWEEIKQCKSGARWHILIES